MIPVIFILVAWWASSGVVAHIRGDRASDPGQNAASNSGPAAGAKAAAPNATASAAGATRSRRPLVPGDVTFRQWQRSLYDRAKRRIRPHIPGQRLGKKATDLLGDITAAALAGSLAFGMGFTLGGAWAGARIANRRVQTRTQRAAGTPKNGPTASGSRRPRNPQPGTPSGGGFNPGPNRSARDQAPLRYATSVGPGSEGVLDFELLDDGQTPSPTTSQYASNEYADVVLPELPATKPTVATTVLNGHAMAEILTIHDLFRFAKGAFEHVVNVVDQSAIRAGSAIERANHALVRSSTATARYESAQASADTAHQHAVQLEETAARFSASRVDPASMTSIGVAITTAVGLAQAGRQRAEAEAAVAQLATAIAAAEQVAAEAAQVEAQAAAVHGEAVKNMHDTVQAHQMPHAEAQAVTGNAAAHESVLAVN